MAFFLLCFDAASPDNLKLNAQLTKMISAVNEPSAIDVAPGAWIVVVPSNWTAQDVRREYHRFAGTGEKLSVVSVDGVLSDRSKIEVDGAVLHWADRWRLPMPAGYAVAEE